MTEQNPPDGDQPANPYGAQPLGGQPSYGTPPPPGGQPSYGTPLPSGQPYAPPPYGQPYGPPPYGAQPGYGPVPGYGAPPIYGPGYGAPVTEGTAIAALCLAIASFFVCPVIPAIIALVLAGNAKRSIAASGGAKTGAGLVTAARVISWANIVIVVLGTIVVVIGLVAVGHSSVGTGTT